MAQKVQILLLDDIDGTEASETVQFGLDGANYEIDLNDKNAGKLRDALSAYVGHARKTTTKRGRATRVDIGPSTREVRDWARSNGYEVSERGRVPAEVKAAYEAAH